MNNFKEYIAKQMVGKRLHFVCSCALPFDIIGVIKGFEISSNEIIFDVEVGDKIMKIGENHPKLVVEEL